MMHVYTCGYWKNTIKGERIQIVFKFDSVVGPKFIGIHKFFINNTWKERAIEYDSSGKAKNNSDFDLEHVFFEHIELTEKYNNGVEEVQSGREVLHSERDYL